LILFAQWLFGKDQSQSIITVSYNEILSSRFSKAVRDAIELVNLDLNKLTFQDIFPGIRIKSGDAAAQLWSLEGQHFSYLGGSFKSTITGLGCKLGIIDDPIKNSEDAYNERVLESHWTFYTDTFLQRLEEESKQIVNHTRWNDKDLSGQLLKADPNDWYVFKLEAFDGKKMLNPLALSFASYYDKKTKISEDIFNANYHQKTTNKKGALYRVFKTYKHVPPGIPKGYTDTADEGDDYLCSIAYVQNGSSLYLTDVIYTQEGMEVTEPMVTKQVIRNRLAKIKIESNNGGRGFARAVKKSYKDAKMSFCRFQWFFQSKNKKARILTNALYVQKNVYYPEDWADKWPEFHQAMTGYQKKGKNTHDDAADALTGCVEDVVLDQDSGSWNAEYE